MAVSPASFANSLPLAEDPFSVTSASLEVSTGLLTLTFNRPLAFQSFANGQFTVIRADGEYFVTNSALITPGATTAVLATTHSGTDYSPVQTYSYVSASHVITSSTGTTLAPVTNGPLIQV